MAEAEQTFPDPDSRLSRIPFTVRDEASIRALSYWMQIAAVVSILGAVFKFVSAFTPRLDLGKIVDAVLSLLIGIWIFQAGASFRKVAATDAADQNHLVEGFRHLRRVFLLQSILVILVFAFLVIAVIVVLLLALARAG